MSKLYIASIQTRPARPRSKNLLGVYQNVRQNESSQSGTSVVYEDLFSKYFGIDDDGNLYVKDTEAGDPRTLWTNGNLIAGGNRSGSTPVSGALYTLADVLRAGDLERVAQADGTTPATNGQVLTYNATTGKWYAATPQSGGSSDVSWNQIYGSTGVKIAEITIGGVKTDVYAPTAGGSAGTVTSVAAEGSGGISVTGGPITTSGTLTVGVDSSHKLPTTIEWNGKQDKIDTTHKLDYSLISGTPESLKNPNALTFGEKTYDGSAAKNLTLADLGGLPKTGGTIKAATERMFALCNTTEDYVVFTIRNHTDTAALASWEYTTVWGLGYSTFSPSGTYLGKMGMDTTGKPYWAGSDYVSYELLHTGNINENVTQLKSRGVVNATSILRTLYATGHNDFVGRITYHGYIAASGGKAGSDGFATSNNANAMLSLLTYCDGGSDGVHQIGFSGNGNIYHRTGLGAQSSIFTNVGWNTIWDSGNSNKSDVDWACKDLTVAGSIKLQLENGIYFNQNWGGGVYVTTDDGGNLYIAAKNKSTYYECEDLVIYNGTSGSGNLKVGGDVYLSAGKMLILDNGDNSNYLNADEDGQLQITTGGGSILCNTNKLHVVSGDFGDGHLEVDGDAEFGGNVCPSGEYNDLGIGSMMWRNLYCNRWYPTSNSNYYIEWDTTNSCFKVHGTIVATGNVIGGTS